MNKNVLVWIVVLFVISIVVSSIVPSYEYLNTKEEMTVETYLKDTLNYKAKVGSSYNKNVSEVKNSDAIVINFKRGLTSEEEYVVVNSLDWQYPIVFFKKDIPADLESFYKFLLSNNLDECYVTSYAKGDKTITITNTKTDTEYTFSCEDF